MVRPLSASMTLALQDGPQTVRSAVTDERGSFKYFGLIPGRYTVHVSSRGFKAIQVRNVMIAEGEDRPLRRFRLRVGLSGGNCTPLMEARSQVQHSGADDVEIRGVIANGGGINVKLIVFGEDRRSESEDLTDNKGRFQFQVPMSGDVRLVFGTVQRPVTLPGVSVNFDANVTTTRPGDRVTVERIGPPFPTIEGFCY
jgi:hypothetical protein